MSVLLFDDQGMRQMIQEKLDSHDWWIIPFVSDTAFEFVFMPFSIS